MNRLASLIFLVILTIRALSSQTISTGRDSITFLSSLENLHQEEKSLVESVTSYLESQKKAPDFFTQKTLKQIQSIRKERGSYFLLEKPVLSEEQEKTQIRFWVYTGKRNLYQGYFSFELKGDRWLLQEVEITSST